MNVSYNLKNNDWTHTTNVSVRGFTFYDSLHYIKENFCELVQYTIQTHGIDALLAKLNGRFAIIIKTENEVFAVVDYVRSYPLFYEVVTDNLTISDQLLLDSLDSKEIDDIGKESFLNCGYCINNLTVVKGIFQVRAGHYLSLKSDISEVEYYNYIPNQLNEKTSKLLKETLNIIFEDYVRLLNNKQVVIPLSGGYDSRLVLLMFHSLGYKNIIAFTYGRKNFNEKEYAKNICKALDITWIDVVYDGIVDDNFIYNKEFIDYFDKGCNASSMAYLQDYFAVRYLKNNNLISKDAVFIPGHTGDFLSGRKLDKELQNSSFKKIKNLILRDHLNFNKNSTLLNHSIDLAGKHWSAYENWILKERQSKFIVNSTYVFDFFGYTCYMPLWDKRLVDFFKSLPFHQKLNGKLYKETCYELFETSGLNFKNEMHPNKSVLLIQNLKNQIKKLLPKFIADKFIDNSDPYCYKQVINQMSKHCNFKTPNQSNNYNAYLVQWYLYLFNNKVNR